MPHFYSDEADLASRLNGPSPPDMHTAGLMGHGGQNGLSRSF